MANKTLYIKDDDLYIWKIAETLSASSMSSYITDLLRNEVLKSQKEEEKDAGGFSEIRVEIDHEDDLRKVSFLGKWLLESRVEDKKEDISGTEYSVALTAKKKFLVFKEKFGEGEFHTYKVFDSFEELKASDELPPGILHSIAKELGHDDIEYLDI